MVEKIEDKIKAQNEMMIDLIVLGQSAECKSQMYWSEITKMYLSIGIDDDK